MRSPRTRLLLSALAGVLTWVIGLWLIFQGPLADRLWPEKTLQGSRPPAGQLMPDLSKVDGLDPPMPAPKQLRGRAVLIVATCLDCRSGDVMGGFLSRLDTDEVADRVALHVIGWEGDRRSWNREYPLDKRLRLHTASNAAEASAVARKLRVGESGIAYLYDRRGHWATTYHLGQLDADDIAHDLNLLETTDHLRYPK